MAGVLVRTIEGSCVGCLAVLSQSLLAHRRLRVARGHELWAGGEDFLP